MVREFDLKQLAASKEFRKIIDHVKQKEDQYILKENGEPQAVLLSIADLVFLENVKSRKAKAWDRLEKVMARVHKKNAQFSPREVDEDVDAAIVAIRNSK